MVSRWQRHMATVRGSHTSSCVVIVDDDPVGREAMVAPLRRAGFEVVEADDGLGGFDALRRSRPKVAIIDVFLPNMSGLELCERIRANPGTCDAFVILVTGIAEPDELPEMALSAGADMALSKPIDPERMVEIVSGAVRGVGANDLTSLD